MALVRNTQASALLQEAVVLDLGDLRRQADAITADARARAEQILTQARSEAQRLAAEAQRKGFETGQVAGLEEGRRAGTKQGHDSALAQSRAQLSQLAQSLTSMLDQVETARAAILSDARGDVLRLALLLAEKVTFRAVAADPSIVDDQIAQALSLVTLTSRPVLRINPAQREHVAAFLPELAARFDAARELTILPDASVQPGGCILQTENAEVDATLETQLRRLVDLLLPAPDDSSTAASPVAEVPEASAQPPQTPSSGASNGGA